MIKKILSTGIVFLFLVSLFATHVEIGTQDGTTNKVPFNGFYHYNWSRTIYLDSEIGESLEISGIGYYVTSNPLNYQMNNQKIYLKHTPATTIASENYVNPEANDAYQLVFEGTINYNGAGWAQITLDENFSYNGTDNLEILCINNNGAYVSNYPIFAKNSTPDINRVSYNSSDSSLPTAPGTLDEFFPCIRFYYTGEGAPTSATLNTPASGAMNVAIPTTLEWTSGSNTDSFAVYLNQNISLVSASDPTALVAENISTTTFVASELTNLTTYYWKVVSTNTTTEYSVASEIFSFTTEAGGGLVVIGNGTLAAQGLPMEPYYGYTISQTIYLQEWLNIENKRVEAISYYYNGYTAWTENNVQIFMSHSDNNQFATTSSWVGHNQLTLVYDGPLTVPSTAGWVELTLDTPFNYNNTQNLVVAFAANSSGYSSNSDEFFCTSTVPNHSLQKQSDSGVLNFVTPPTGTLKSAYPNVKLAFGDLPSTPQLVITPESYNWEPTTVGTQAVPATFTLSNSGLGSLTINSVSLEGEDAFSITDQNTYPLVITSNVAQFVVNFQPEAIGDFTANITVTDSANNETIIPLTGSGNDTMISEFPHFEGFETTTSGEMPDNWTSIITSTTSAFVEVYTAYVYDGAKSLRFANQNDHNPTHIMAVTPPILNPAGKRIEFYARAATTRMSIGVGTTNSSTNPGAYNELMVFPLTTSYQMLNMNLTNAGTDDTMIVFKYYGNNGTYNQIHMDNLTIEDIPTGSSALITPTALDFGNIHVNRIGVSTLTIENWGSDNLIADFISEDGLFTFMENQVTIVPGAEETIIVFLNPVTEGAFSDSFTIETNANNAPSTTITATATILPALPEGLAVIGNGTETNLGLPIEPWYKNNYSQTIYYANEIGIADRRIEKISWKYNGANAWGPDELRIFMGETTKTEFSGNTDWFDITEFSEVFTGTIEVPGNSGWVETILNIPFMYDNSKNLVVGVYRSSEDYHSNDDEFYCTTTDQTRSIVYYSDYAVPDPTAPPTATHTRNAIPNVQLQFGEVPEDADLVVYPLNSSFGLVPIDGTSLPKTITMRSIGLSDVTIATAPIITGDDADQFTISTDLNDYPLTIPFMETATFEVTCVPTSEGTKSATIEIVDNSTRTTRIVTIAAYAYPDDGNNEAINATLLTLPVEGDTYAIMPVGDIDWYKIPTMTAGDTLLILAEATEESDITIKSWLYGPVTDPTNIVGSSHISNGSAIEHILTASGDYYLRVAKNTVSPSPETQRKNFNGERTETNRADTGLYNLFVDANYNYDFNAPISLEAFNRTGFVELNWVEPEFERYLVSYNIYRNDELLNSEPIPLGTTSFDDTNVIVGTNYTYYLIGIYAEPTGQSIPSNRVTITYYNAGEPIWGDNFEEHPDFTLNLANWIQHDVDGGSTYGISNIEFPNAGEPMSYMVFNPSATTPPITDITPHEGDKFLASFASSAGANDDWIITPRIALGEHTVVSFFARSFSSDYSAEKFKVRMSLSGSEPADFQYSLHQAQPYLTAPTVWTPYYFDMTQLAGNTARFAIQCVSENAFIFMVDKFRIDGTDDTVDNQDGSVAPALTNLEQNYPNPFNPETTIAFSLQAAGDVTVDIYNLKGQKVKTLLNEQKEAGKHSVVWNGTDENNKNVSSGVYFYKLKSGKSSVSRKMILMK